MDFTLWCPIGAVYRLRKELRIEPVLRDVQAVKDQQDRTITLHSLSDGMMEWFNRTLLQHLSTVVDGHQEDWGHCIPLFMQAYRSSIHERTHHKPRKVIFGHKLKLPCDLEFETPPEKTTPINGFVIEMTNHLSRTHKIVKNKLHLASNRMKTRYDICANSPGFSTGDHVWLYNPVRKKGCCPKLQQDSDGPYVIVKPLNDVVYQIQILGGWFKVVHVDWLALWNGDYNSDHGFEEDAQPQRGSCVMPRPF